jgi:hypothetical protein
MARTHVSVSIWSDANPLRQLTQQLLDEVALVQAAALRQVIICVHRVSSESCVGWLLWHKLHFLSAVAV